MTQPAIQYYSHYGDYLSKQTAQAEIRHLGLRNINGVPGISLTKDMSVGVYVPIELDGKLRVTVGLKKDKIFTLEQITVQTPILVHS